MLYVLHHSKGALVLSANNKEQVVEWSKRQLGTNAKTISVMESDLLELTSQIEGSGTGLQMDSEFGCRPLMSITADLSQGLNIQQEGAEDFSSLMVERRKFAREPIWH
jgi:hypothetical protein